MRLVRDGFSRRVVAAEIEKCDVRCRNCHAIATYERMGKNWRSLAVDGSLDRDDHLNYS